MWPYLKNRVNIHKMKKKELPLQKFESITVTLLILSGITLLSLLPLGAIIGITSPYFDYAGVLHIILLSLALLTTAIFVLRLALLSTTTAKVSLFISALFILFAALNSFAPVTARDALIHHLAVPKWWVEAGRIIDINWHEWSYYPMLLNLAYTFLLKHDLEHLCGIYHLSYLLLLAGVVSMFLWRKLRDAETALLGFLITVSLPINIRLAAGPLVDLGLALYATVTVIALVRWGTEGFFKRYAFTAGLALGLALGCKYNALLFAVVLFFTTLIFASRRNAKPAQIITAVFLVAFPAILLFSPWLFKNILWAGNPLYPLYKGILGGATTSAGVPTLKPLEQRFLLYGESWFDIVTMPLRMIILGADGSGRTYDGVLSPVLFLAIFPLFALKNQNWKGYFYLTALIYFVFAIFMAAARVRYNAPIFGIILVLSAAGFKVVSGFFESRYKKLITAIIITIHTMFAAGYCYTFEKRKAALAYIFQNDHSSKAKSEYLKRTIPEYGMIEYINNNLPEDSVVYLLYTGNKFYYYHRNVISGGHFSANWLLRRIKHARSADDLARDLRRRGVTHLMAHLERTRRGFEEILSDEDKLIWNEFIRDYARPIYADNGFGLWEIAIEPLNNAEANDTPLSLPATPPEEDENKRLY
ncbi:MAG: hypothetical protein D6719_12760 [Candidatus Dadabacteria bacterium]|nr:MAG: hypothetical protein D6719_12760 [Candidatus Dadabacteria bacterium]